ncbi:DEAD/DEAH box helicase [Micromonospora eburnea]|uniref:DEAD/DEAH box helicase n=1 Tax=Micromonospora eburnea TaxID=227316 RepID=A0A1C6TSB4_9ACTN|nr:DEAD/DEAH box helicase [Micromonospora eburnea]SCL44704.1 DEAD/DEAH box helicase [Micromonospora eburnea]
MAFKRRTPTPVAPDDPVELYRTLSETNNGPAALWLHQGDVLRSWHSGHRGDPDVAIELPTGAGKTLVGGLIGEYQRRALNERVAYLCPTRQLARQTAAALKNYGIPTSLLVGAVPTWNRADRARYTSAQSIAVSTYAHVFNSNPALDDAQLLLLDDAHSVESYVASPWSLEISRSESAYGLVLAELKDSLDPLVAARLRNENPDGQFLTRTYLASPTGVAAHAERLEEIVRAACSAETVSKSARYAYQMLAGKLDRCLLYATYSRLLFRPLIAPSTVHPAFSNPAQRVYMSATLGDGGELERSFGRRKIKRIPIPKGWEKQGTGRRLFCFPELTTDLSVVRSDLGPWVKDVIAKHRRAVVLTPDGRTAAKFTEHRVPKGFATLTAQDVEDDLSSFTTSPDAVLVLSNRYDGIDLPDDACRLVILDGLPAKGDLQERFLFEELGALEVLQERIRARIVQGSGRATRNARDFATVLVLGDDLTRYIGRADVKVAMRPEIHAEVQFGYDNSLGCQSSEMAENIEVFQQHGAEWREVDADIIAHRDALSQVPPAGAAELQRAAGREVAAWEAVWQGEWERALDLIRQVLDNLRGGKAPQRYAALWHYLGSCIARRLAMQTGDATYAEASAAYYRDARAAGRGTNWLSHLAAPVEEAQQAEPALVDPLDEVAVSSILARLSTLGKSSTFEPEMERIRTGLGETPAKPYEAALVGLGHFSGATDSVGNGDADAAPDATWTFGDLIWIAWEAKSEAKPEGEIGASDVRQAGGHLRFVADKRGEAAPGDSVSLLVSAQHTVHPAARAVAENHVYLVRPSDVLDLFERLNSAWRMLRAIYSAATTGDDVVRIFKAEGALPSQWLPHLRQVPIASPEPEQP